MEDLIIEITAGQSAVSIIKELERIGYIQAYNIRLYSFHEYIIARSYGLYYYDTYAVHHSHLTKVTLSELRSNYGNRKTQ